MRREDSRPRPTWPNVSPRWLPTWCSTLRSAGYSCPAASRWPPARASSTKPMPRRCAPSCATGRRRCTVRPARHRAGAGHRQGRRLPGAARSAALPHPRPGGAANPLSRLRDHRAAAALLRAAAHRTDAAHPRGLRSGCDGLRQHRRRAPAEAEVLESVRRPGRSHRRSRFHLGSDGGAAAVPMRSRGAARSMHSGPAPGMPAWRPAKARPPTSTRRT